MHLPNVCSVFTVGFNGDCFRYFISFDVFMGMRPCSELNMYNEMTAAECECITYSFHVFTE